MSSTIEALEQKEQSDGSPKAWENPDSIITAVMIHGGKESHSERRTALERVSLDSDRHDIFL